VSFVFWLSVRVTVGLVAWSGAVRCARIVRGLGTLSGFTMVLVAPGAVVVVAGDVSVVPDCVVAVAGDVVVAAVDVAVAAGDVVVAAAGEVVVAAGDVVVSVVEVGVVGVAPGSAGDAFASQVRASTTETTTTAPMRIRPTGAGVTSWPSAERTSVPWASSLG
jgi:hypothetical protein